MESLQGTEKLAMRRGTVLAMAAVMVLSMAACGSAMMMFGGTGAKRPPATAFGLGPRSSDRGLYVATIEADGQLRTRRMQTVRVTVADADGRTIDGATLTIDGGMPEHGHGLPTRPRVTGNPGAGVYVIEGVRFNMGGWWEFKLSIATDRGTDIVTFNLDL